MKANELKALEKRIEMLEAVEAIKHLKAEYAAVCDDKYNPPKAVKLFTEDAVWDGGKDFGVHRGRPSIKKFFEEVAQNIVFAVHFFLQPIIKINKDGKTATGKWYLCHPELDDVTPLRALAQGRRREVLDLLGRIFHGIPV